MPVVALASIPTLAGRRGAAVIGWALAFVQVATIQPSQRFAFPTPWTWEHGLLAALFLVTSVGFVTRPRRALLVALHVAVVALLVALHPLTAFGRDGSAIVLMGWLVIAVAQLPLRREWTVAVASACLALVVAESLASLGRESPLPDLPDYSNLFGQYGRCGFLKPNLDLEVIGENAPARFVTDELGLRRDVDLSGPAAGRRRVLFVGDSFVAGYRTDQRDLLSVQIGRRWRDGGRGVIEVMAAGAGYPGAAVDVVRECGARVRPDVVLVGVTIGNDLAQTWFESRGLSQDALKPLLLPPSASRTTLGLLPMRLRASLDAWRVFRRVHLAFGADVLRPWYEESPRAIHIFDPGHSIGLFYAREPLSEVEAAYADLSRTLVSLAAEARGLGARLRVVVIPQRFQMTDREWGATLFAYGLDPAAFDREAPNRRLASVCAAADVVCVDLLPAMREAARGAVLYLRGGDMHWNRQAQAVAAEALVPVVRDALAGAPAR